MPTTRRFVRARGRNKRKQGSRGGRSSNWETDAKPNRNGRRSSAGLPRCERGSDLSKDGWREAAAVSARTGQSGERESCLPPRVSCGPRSFPLFSNEAFNGQESPGCLKILPAIHSARLVAHANGQLGCDSTAHNPCVVVGFWRRRDSIGHSSCGLVTAGASAV